MEQKDFKISRRNYAIIIQKDNQEFLEFFRYLISLEQRLNKPVETIQQEEPKKLSLFKRFNKKKYWIYQK